MLFLSMQDKSEVFMYILNLLHSHNGHPLSSTFLPYSHHMVQVTSQVVVTTTVPPENESSYIKNFCKL